MECRWEGNTLHIRRSGIDGRIAVAPDGVRVQARLGMMTSLLRGTIEEAVHREFDEHFA